MCLYLRTHLPVRESSSEALAELCSHVRSAWVSNVATDGRHAPPLGAVSISRGVRSTDLAFMGSWKSERSVQDKLRVAARGRPGRRGRPPTTTQLHRVAPDLLRGPP